MMNECLILVDNSNIFIEGQKCSAKKKGILKTNVADRDPCDVSWRLNFGNLLDHLAHGRRILDAILVGSRPPQSDNVWEAARLTGFQVIVYNRSGGVEKAVDTELVAQGTEIICSLAGPSVLVIASGDRDFIPLVNVAHRKKWEVEMCAFSSSFSPAGDMAMSVDRIRPLDSDYLTIGKCAFAWPPPTGKFGSDVAEISAATLATTAGTTNPSVPPAAGSAAAPGQKGTL
jgi:uncharacterized LabA/DUF88 family protein